MEYALKFRKMKVERTGNARLGCLLMKMGGKASHFTQAYRKVQLARLIIKTRCKVTSFLENDHKCLSKCINPEQVSKLQAMGIETSFSKKLAVREKIKASK